MISDLIYDVGMHDGGDTAYYLSLGYRVVAIEANPALVEAARARFAREISAGRLTLCPVAIAEEPGIATLWVNNAEAEHSSLDARMASRYHKDLTPVEVEAKRLDQVLAAEGVPFYLKIDIEGADMTCLRALSPSDLPAFVSVEGHSLAPLCELHRLGYRHFKCINQLWHHAPEHGVRPAFGAKDAIREAWRLSRAGLVRRLGRFGPVGRRLQRWAAPVRRKPDATPDSPGVAGPAAHRGTSVPYGSSGPFGDATFGAWRTFEEVAYDWLHVRFKFAERSTLRVPGWFDFHARRDPEA